MALTLALESKGPNSTSSIVEKGSLGRKTALTSAKPNQDAIETALSNRKSDKSANVQSLKALSDTDSFLSIAKNAVGEIDSLLDRISKIKDVLDTSITAEQRSTLEDEASEVLSQIETVQQNAEFNESSVINAGTFDVQFSQRNSTTGEISSITVPNIATTSSQLGISTLTASSLTSSTASETISTARSILSDTSSLIDAKLSEVRSAVETQAPVERGSIQDVREAVSTKENIISQLKSFADSHNNSSVITAETLLKS